MLHRLVVSALSVAILFTGVIGLSQSTKAQEFPARDTIYSRVTVTLDNIKRGEVYDFVTDISNEPLWYPGVISSELIQESTRPNSLVGRKYLQTAFVTESLTTTTEIEVKHAAGKTLYVVEGNGDLADFDAKYMFLPYNRAKGTQLIIWVRYEAPGFTPETFAQYFEFAMSGLPNYYADRSAGNATVDYVFFQ